MWKQWTITILGVIFVIAPFLGLTTFIFKFTMALGGLLFAILGFWALSEEKLKKESFVERPHEF
jgi:hypothetical protein